MNASRDREFSILRFASARMHSPTNFAVSSETSGMSTRGSIDAVQQSTFGNSIAGPKLADRRGFLLRQLRTQSALATL
jgi:hypothetical protein